MTLLLKLRVVAAAAILVAGAHVALAVEKTQLLTPDGRLYVVRAGAASDLGIAGNQARPEDNVIQWSCLRQDGSLTTGLVPGTVGGTLKHNLELAFDEPTGSLAVLFTEELPLVNLLRLGILKADQWTVCDLLPNVGFPSARNPRMLISHPVVHTLDADGKDVWMTRSVLSVIYWEVSNVSQARYAPFFMDEDTNASDVNVYDLPATIGAGGSTPAPPDIPAGAYLYPSLQIEGPGGGVLATFADLNSDRQRVVRISFPTDLGKPGSTNPTWLRRHTPIVGAVLEAPIPRMAPRDGSTLIRTFVGTSYRPTLAWRDDSAVRFLRFDGQKWSEVNSVALSDGMSEDKALGLVQDMATKN